MGEEYIDYWYDDWYIPLSYSYTIEDESPALILDATPQYDFGCGVICYLDEALIINEDFDGDGKLDVAEDLNQNGIMDIGEDVDGDGFLDIDEDIDNDNILDIGTEIFINHEDSNVYHRNGLSNSEKNLILILIIILQALIPMMPIWVKMVCFTKSVPTI